MDIHLLAASTDVYNSVALRDRPMIISTLEKGANFRPVSVEFRRQITCSTYPT